MELPAFKDIIVGLVWEQYPWVGVGVYCLEILCGSTELYHGVVPEELIVSFWRTYIDVGLAGDVDWWLTATCDAGSVSCVLICVID
jgi:hypothetical protein